MVFVIMTELSAGKTWIGIGVSCYIFLF